MLSLLLVFSTRLRSLVVYQVLFCLAALAVDDIQDDVAQRGDADENWLSTRSIPGDSGIPHGQPWGMQHTYEGAMAKWSRTIRYIRTRSRCRTSRLLDWNVVSQVTTFWLSPT